MGNKVNPIGMRLQVNRTWDSRWYADTKDYGNLLLEDLAMRKFIGEECKQAGISRVIIERPHKKCRVTIHTARPGVIIGKNCTSISSRCVSPSWMRPLWARASHSSLSVVCPSVAP